MRLAILMPVHSPWAREAARLLAAAGNTVFVLDFADQSARKQSYVGTIDFEADADYKAFHCAVADIITLPCPVTSQARYVVAARALRRSLQECGADCLLALYAGGNGLMALLSGFQPYAVFAVGSDVLKVRHFRRAMARIGLRRAAAVFANGDYLARKAEELVPGVKVTSLLLGVDTTRFTPVSRTDAPRRILCTRGFTTIYNNDYLIRGLAQLPPEPPDYRATFVSGGHLLPDAKALADSILPPTERARVEFLGGVPFDRLLSELRRSHIYVSLSRSDGTSTSLLEALACGLIPVLSDIPQNREWVFPDRRNGFLVPLDDPPALAKVLATALRPCEDWSEAIAFNRRQVQERADISRNMALLAERLRSIAKDTKRA